MVLYFIFIIRGLLRLILLIVYIVLRNSLNIKRSSFESGFTGVGFINTQYSIYFFILLLVFLLFDLEIVILLYFIFNNLQRVSLFLLIFTFVLLTYYLEVYFSKVQWSI